jgi:hypothetical protein
MKQLIGTLTLTALALSTAPVSAQPAQAVPWANKLFLTGIEKNPTQPPPPVITHDFGTVPRGTLCIHKFTITNIYDVPMQVSDIRRSCGCLEAYPPQKVLQPFEKAEFVVTMDTGKFVGPNAPLIYVTFRGVANNVEYRHTALLRIQGTSRADVNLSPGAVNFGIVAQGSQPNQTVALEYSGKQRDWKVTGVLAPTGPLEVQVREAERNFLWGAKYYLAVALKSSAPAGQLNEVITLRTNDPASPLVQVNITGTIQAPLTLSPDRLDFGKVRLGEPAEHKVWVRAAGNQIFRVQPVSEDADGVSVETTGIPGPNQILTIRFRPTRTGPVQKEILLKTDLGGGATVRLVVIGEGEPAAAAGR